MERISTTRCNSVLILICVVILCAIMAFFTNSGQIYHQPIETPSETAYISKIDTIWTSDTVYRTRLVPKETIIHRFDTIRKDTILPIIENKIVIISNIVLIRNCIVFQSQRIHLAFSTKHHNLHQSEPHMSTYAALLPFFLL